MDNYKDLFYSEEVQSFAKIICELAKECWNLGLSDSTGFSISQCIPNSDAILVDKSGTGFRRNNITPDDLLLIDSSGNLLFQASELNSRKAPANIVIHLKGYICSDAQSCIHWHDPFTNAFSTYGKTIHPLTVQSKLIGDVPCVLIDDRKKKKENAEFNLNVEVPSGLHSRPDVYAVMKEVGEEIGTILNTRNKEFERHGIIVTHFEHGLFAFGRNVEESFENAYRSFRNAQTIIYSRLLSNYPDERAKENQGPGDSTIIDR